MRPRINSFGKITRNELHRYLIDNYVFNFIVKINDETLVYQYNIMFRKNKEAPEVLFVEVSKTSKLVLCAWTNKGKKFDNINELKLYTKK